MKKIVVILISLFVFVPFVKADELNIYLFYSDICSTCEAEIEFLEDYVKENDLNLVMYETTKSDENANLLGEIALVECDSPIARTNLVFNTTLFDENASCHLSLGRAFSNNILGYEKMSLDDIKNFKMNDSMIHVDFMIGTKDLEIVAVCKDKTQVQIFKNGNWAF